MTAVSVGSFVSTSKELTLKLPKDINHPTQHVYPRTLTWAESKHHIRVQSHCTVSVKVQVVMSVMFQQPLHKHNPSNHMVVG